MNKPMLSVTRDVLISVIILSALPQTVPAAEFPSPNKRAGDLRSGRVTNEVPVYKPPSLGSVKVRVHAGSRSADDPLPTIHVLAPDHVGSTTNEHPALFWYLSKPTTHLIVFTLVTTNRPAPLLELKLNDSARTGINRLPLGTGKSALSLMPGVDYQWFIAVVPDAAARSKDVVAKGVVRRVVPGPEFRQRIAQTKERERPFVFAQEGLWYDTIESLWDLIQANPNDAALPRQLSALLEQVDLKEVHLPTSGGIKRE